MNAMINELGINKIPTFQIKTGFCLYVCNPAFLHDDISSFQSPLVPWTDKGEQPMATRGRVYEG